MITTIIISSVLLNVLLTIVLYSLNKEKPNEKIKVVYKDKLVEKIVYKDRIVEKVVYKDKPIKHNFVVKPEPKVSKERQELIDALNELRDKKKKSKKDQENIYTIEKILPNIK